MDHNGYVSTEQGADWVRVLSNAGGNVPEVCHKICDKRHGTGITYNQVLIRLCFCPYLNLIKTVSAEGCKHMAKYAVL